jgi:hypothetical protein
MKKTMYVKVAARFSLKNAPKGQLGLRQESWVFGNSPVSFGELVKAFIYHLLEFHIATLPMTSEELNAEIEKVRDALSSLSVVDEVEEKKED